MKRRPPEPLVGVRRRLVMFSIISLGLMFIDTVVLQEHGGGFPFWFGAGISAGVALLEVFSRAGRWRMALCRRAWLAPLVLGMAAAFLQAGRLVAFCMGATYVLVDFRVQVAIGASQGRQRRDARRDEDG
ncbi:MAG: hypothetical protein KatS3mg014_1829 [Actinomycetota bacterium]|nr:MAG: hypothetical protein KatS3mg014_1829 [Actinomycetota bacterium]